MCTMAEVCISIRRLLLFLPVIFIIHKLKLEHDIITRDAYSVSWAEIWEFSKSQRDIIDAVTV